MTGETDHLLQNNDEEAVGVIVTNSTPQNRGAKKQTLRTTDQGPDKSRRRGCSCLKCCRGCAYPDEPEFAFEQIRDLTQIGTYVTGALATLSSVVLLVLSQSSVDPVVIGNIEFGCVTCVVTVFGGSGSH